MTSDFDAPLRIGTRRSKLALWQANHIAGALRTQWPELRVELVEIVTEGDRVLDRPLAEIGGKGLFVNEIEERLAKGEVDLAVHSTKDLPAKLGEGLELACTPERADPRDALIAAPGLTLENLPAGTRLGTSSPRRAALARRANPGLDIVSIRGNVPTRLGKVDSGEVDAVLLAAAGLKRLGLGERIGELLDPERFCPAAGQGILGLEIRASDERARRLIAPLHHQATGIAATVERGFLGAVEGGCRVPVGCHATLSGEGRVFARAVIADPSGRPYFHATETGAVDEAAELGRALAQTLIRLGAGRLVEGIAALT